MLLGSKVNDTDRNIILAAITSICLEGTPTIKKTHLLLLLLGFGISANLNASPPEETLTVTVQGDGIVTSDPSGINCPSECTEAYKKGSTIILTATTAENSSFIGWQGACVGTQPTCEIKLTSPTMVTASFEIATTAYPAPVPQTGQALCVDQSGPIDCAGTGQDGDLKAGVALPAPRFTDNGDGTVTDNANGLRWLKDVGCLGTTSFEDSFNVVLALNAGTDMSCTDYIPGTFNDWHVPNINELLSLVNYAYYAPPISNTQGDGHWSEGDPFVNMPVKVNDPCCGDEGACIRSSTHVAQPSSAINSASIYGLQTGGAEVLDSCGSTRSWHFTWAVRDAE